LEPDCLIFIEAYNHKLLILLFSISTYLIISLNFKFINKYIQYIYQFKWFSKNNKANMKFLLTIFAKQAKSLRKRKVSFMILLFFKKKM